MSSTGISTAKRPREASRELPKTVNAKRVKASSSPSKDGTETVSVKAEEEDDIDNLRQTVRHAKHYYADGSVVLQFGDTLLKLHRSILERDSVYFARCFADQIDEEDYEYYDGVPLYELEPEDMEDFIVVLDILYNPLNTLLEKPSFTTLSSILRCSESFEFETYRAWAAKTFKEAWSREPEDIPMEQLPLSSALQAIAIVTEYKMPDLRKRAFYEVARRSDMGLEETVKKHDNNGDNPKAANVMKSSCGFKLSRKQISTIVAARRFFEDTCFKRLGSMPHLCYTCDARKRPAFSWSTIIASNFGFVRLWSTDPVIALSILIGDRNLRPPDYSDIYSWPKSVTICATCIERAQAMFRSDLKGIWDKLDTIFTEDACR